MKVFTFCGLSKIYQFRTDDALGISIQCWKYDHRTYLRATRFLFAGCDQEPAGFRDQLFNGWVAKELDQTASSRILCKEEVLRPQRPQQWSPPGMTTINLIFCLLFSWKSKFIEVPSRNWRLNERKKEGMVTGSLLDRLPQSQLFPHILGRESGDVCHNLAYCPQISCSAS